MADSNLRFSIDYRSLYNRILSKHFGFQDNQFAAYKNQAQEAVTSLFGGSDEIMIPEPKLPKINPWPLIE